MLIRFIYNFWDEDIENVWYEHKDIYIHTKIYTLYTCIHTQVLRAFWLLYVWTGKCIRYLNVFNDNDINFKNFCIIIEIDHCTLITWFTI